ncbi:50S ribosomal protein L5 [Alphaproteobacteria bacterium]|nr:50S ribosomal protein L5 [Alphaproteobacteria bacterium]
MSYLKNLYDSKVKQQLKKDLSLANDYMVPRLEKIVLNCCCSDAAHDGKVLQSIVDEMTAIAGQKAVVVKAKKSIAGFKLREGANLGAKVTLRREMMYCFLDRLIYMALPKVRDFMGLSSKGFDGNGNYAFGLKEQIVFNEINYDKVDKVRGFDVIVCTSARNNDDGLALLKSLNFPFSQYAR